MEKYVRNLAAVMLIAVISSAASASVITLYELDKGTVGTNLNNSDTTKSLVLDTAPLGTAEFHDEFNDGTSSGPAWVSTGTVGNGVGMEFSRTDGDGDRTRVTGWLHTSQGSYSEGKSFTVMARVKAAEAVDGRVYNIFGLLGYDSLALEGTSTGQLTIKTVVRDGTANGGSEVRWYATSGDNSNNELFFIDTDKWYNVFLIYNANSSIILAADDGTTFVSNTNTSVPAGFDSLSHLFSDSSRHWVIGGNSTTAGTFEGTIEAISVYDGALSLSEADAMTIPEPATAAFLGLGLISLLKRRK